MVDKHELEAALRAEKQDIASGKLKEDNPLDLSERFETFCEACRRGDLKVCQEKIIEGVNINARDRFDYTPLILVSHISLFPSGLQKLVRRGRPAIAPATWKTWTDC